LLNTVGQLIVDVSLSTGFLNFTAGFDLSTPFPKTPRSLHIAHNFSILAPPTHLDVVFLLETQHSLKFELRQQMGDLSGNSIIGSF
jgi:hypothetical protein